MFCQAWAREDLNKTQTEITTGVLGDTMKGIDDFLEFTFKMYEFGLVVTHPKHVYEGQQGEQSRVQVLGQTNGSQEDYSEKISNE